jgi:hypothetical protein
MHFSAPLGHTSSIAAIRCEGFLLPNASMSKKQLRPLKISLLMG